MKYHDLIRRYRRKRSAKVFPYNPWNTETEPGDLMVSCSGMLYRLEESSGWGKRQSGVLTPRTIDPPTVDLIAVIHGNEIWWARRKTK